MLNLVLNPQEGRVRAGWRLLAQATVFVATVLGLAELTKVLGPGPWASVFVSLLYVGIVVGSIAVLCRLLDHRPMASLGLRINRQWWGDFGFGLLLGASLISGIFASAYLAGWLRITGRPTTTYAVPIGVALLVRLTYWIATGLNEELVFRGYQLTNLADGLAGGRLGSRTAFPIAAVISSSLFGLAHLGNENATAVSTINILLAGALLSLPVLLTGQLAISMGLHIAWNLFEGTVFGFAVSGGVPGTRLMTIQLTGPALWTGGAFGPEAGLLAVVAMLVACALVVVRFRAAGRNRRSASPVIGAA